LILLSLVLAYLPTIGAQVPTNPQQSTPTATSPKPQKTIVAAKKPCAPPGVPAGGVQEVVDASYALPPPLASDAMIRIAARVASPCPDLAETLLESAFDQADTVEPRTGYKLALAGGPTDSRVNFSDHGYSQRMDRLSLQSRVVLGMVLVDAKQAIRFFQRISPPRPQAAGCANPFVPDVSIYYKALGEILSLLKPKSPFNNAEGQVAFLQLQEVAGATTSPVQLAPLTKVLGEANLSPAEVSLIMNALAADIESFPVDDRSLSTKADENDLAMAGPVATISHDPSAMPSGSSLLLSDVMYDLVALSKQNKISSYPVVNAYRDYLARSVQGPHCQGNLRAQSLGSIYKALNSWLARFAPGIEPVGLPESAPTVESDPDQGEYWLSPKTTELLVDAKRLNFDDNWQRYTDADRHTPEWRDRVVHLLDRMNDWRASDEPDPADYLHQRCILLYRILGYLPPGALYDRVVAAWLATLAESSLQWDNPAEWYLEVEHFMEYSQKNGKESVPVAAISALKNSSSISLHACGLVAEFLQ
jgi:hypothetical protein